MALATVQSTFLGSATTTERNSQLTNRNLLPGTIFFNITTSTMQITQLGGNSPLWEDLSTESFVSSEIGNITPASIGAPQTDGTGATGTWGVDITGNSSTVTTNADLTGDVTSNGNTTTLETVNTNVGAFGGASNVGSFTVNAKGQLTAAANVTITPSAIGAPQTDGTGATGTWGVDITGNSSTVTTNANLTGPVESTGNLTTIPNGNITVDMLDSLAKPTFQNCYDADSSFELDIDPFAIKAEVVTELSVNSYSGTSAQATFTQDWISGFKFTAGQGPSETMKVTHLQYVDANFNLSFGATRQVGIYDVATQNLLGQVSVSKTDPLVDGFRTKELVTPVFLTLGQEYTVVAVVPVGETYWAGTSFTPASKVSSVVVAVSPPSSTLVFPSSFGGTPNQIQAGGFVFDIIAIGDVFSVSDDETESKNNHKVGNQITVNGSQEGQALIHLNSVPTDSTGNCIVMSGIANATIAVGQAITVSPTIDFRYEVIPANSDLSIIGFCTKGGVSGEKINFCCLGQVQAKMEPSGTATRGDYLRRSSSDAGLLEQAADASKAVAVALQSVTAGQDVIVQFFANGKP